MAAISASLVGSTLGVCSGSAERASSLSANRASAGIPFKQSLLRQSHAEAPRRSLAAPRASVATEPPSAAPSELNQKFGGEGVSVDSGLGELPRVVLKSSDGSTADVYLYGACTTSWVLPSGEDLLFVRPDAVFTGQKPISGGIPHCFPQFGPGVMQQHGFARNLTWEIHSTKTGASPSVTLRLVESDYTRAMWDFSFEALFEITLSAGSLSTVFTVTNTDTKPFSFTTALHSYFRAAISEVRVEGLKGLQYLNKDPDPKNPIPGTETRESVTFPGFVDCMYLNAPSALTLDNGLGKKVVISNEGWKDAVVWSPYLTMEACYKDFVCVENAQLDEVTVQPGASWKATQKLEYK